tara:strand:- start:675 stop:836 length:162 start_codon:yes stop_codon:yes gene_type:complete
MKSKGGFKKELRELIVKWRNDFYLEKYGHGNSADYFAYDVDMLHNEHHGWFDE